MRVSLTLSLAFLLTSSLVHAQCPHQDSGLTQWSSEYGSVSTDSDVVIDAGKRILLDVSPPKLRSILVKGELVLSDTALLLNTTFIRVDGGGSFIGGSEACPLTAKIHITFFGARSGEENNDMGLDSVLAGKQGTKGMVIQSNGRLDLHGTISGPTWTRIARTVPAGTRVLHLTQSVPWKAGDKVVVANTDFPGQDYFPEQSEEMTIESVSGSQVTLTEELKYMHYSGPHVAGEVGLLTRNMVMAGAEDSGSADEFGGHLMMRAVTTTRISAVEFTRMGQKGVVGRYPIHFHQTGNAVGKGHYVKQSAMHNNFQRCIAIHDTDGILVQQNVAYKTHGHCYFIEDGSEALNTLDGNLGVLSLPVKADDPRQIIPSDFKPTIFWITNPNNTIINNVGVSATHCFWYSLPKLPNGLSTDKYANTKYLFPRLTPLLKFSDNTAHGCNENGIMVDENQDMEGRVTDLSAYTPVVGATSADDAPWQFERVPAIFERFVAYKCRSHGIWTRGAGMVFTGPKVLDNSVGVLMIPGPSFFVDALVVGETDNIGTPVSPNWLDDMPRSRPTIWTNKMPVRGIQHYDAGGPQFYKNVKFYNFTTNEFRPAGAQALLRNGPNMLHAENRMRDLTYINSNRVYLERWDPNPVNDMAPLDGPKAVNVMDVDGSTTGEIGGWIVSENEIIYDNGGCVQNKDWNAYVCPRSHNQFGQLVVENLNIGGTDFAGTNTQKASEVKTGDTRATFYKLQPSGTAAVKLDVTGRKPDEVTRDSYTANLRMRHAYSISFPHPTPPSLKIRIMGAAAGEWFHVAIPYKGGTTFDIITGWAKTKLTPAASLAELDRWQYYYDTSTSHLHLRLEQPKHVMYEQWGFAAHQSYDADITITASCGNACGGTDATPPPRPQMREEHVYGGVLQGCQLSPAVPTNAGGYAYILYNPDTKLVSTIIHHSLGDRVTGARIQDKSGAVIHTLSAIASPIQVRFAVSHAQLVALYKGEWAVHLNSVQHSGGELHGALSCLDAAQCKPPPQVSVASACRTPTQSVDVWTGTEASDWTIWSWKMVKPAPVTEAANKICGASALEVPLVKGGGMAFNLRTAAIDPSQTPLLELWIKSKDVLDPMILMNLGDKDGEQIVKDKWVPITSAHIENYLITPKEFTRVRVPITEFGPNIVSGQIATVIVLMNWEQKVNSTVFIDQVRFVSADADEMSPAITDAPGKFLSGCQETQPPPSSSPPDVAPGSSPPTSTPTPPGTANPPAATTPTPTPSTPPSDPAPGNPEGIPANDAPNDPNGPQAESPLADDPDDDAKDVDNESETSAGGILGGQGGDTNPGDSEDDGSSVPLYAVAIGGVVAVAAVGAAAFLFMRRRNASRAMPSNLSATPSPYAPTVPMRTGGQVQL